MPTTLCSASLYGSLEQKTAWQVLLKCIFYTSIQTEAVTKACMIAAVSDTAIGLSMDSKFCYPQATLQHYRLDARGIAMPPVPDPVLGCLTAPLLAAGLDVVPRDAQVHST